MGRRIKSIEVVIDDKLRIRLSSLSIAVRKEIRKAFTHKNPTFYKMKAMGFWPKEDKEIKTWSHVKDSSDKWWLCLPRGGMQRLRDIFKSNFINWYAIDNRSTGDYFGEYTGDWVKGDIFPEQNLTHWSHQIKIAKAVERYENCLVRAPTGCLTGDMMIGINRGGKGRQVRLDHIVKMFNGGISSGRIWNKDIPTMIRSRMDDGSVRLIRLSDAYESGIKEVYEVKLQGNRIIKSTLDHRYLTSEGWKELRDITIGTKIFTEKERIPKSKIHKSKNWYNSRRVRHHPYAGRKNVKDKGSRYTVSLHRLVVEANLNGLALEEFISICNTKNIPDNICFLDPKKFIVHHLDGDVRNNKFSNLGVMSVSEHKKEHEDLYIQTISVLTELSEVISIKYIGKRKTYDLSLSYPHNFLANGVVVHNSGKTSAMIYVITQVQLSTIVIVWSTSLLKQWIDRVSKELGIAKKDIGIIQGKRCKLKPFTVAMQQTLNRYTQKEWDNIKNSFGLVICDEVQRYAAKTFTETITKFNSKFRVGVSADERRRDKKEFLIYDMFGRVVEDIPHNELVAKNLIHDVEIRIVPTDFQAEWYVDQMIEDETPDFTTLIEEMITDADRNEKIRSIIARLAKRGYRLLVFSQRVDHCRILDSLITASGYRSGLFLGGKDNKDLFEATRKGLMDGSRQVGIGTLSGGSSVGLDIPQVSHGLLTTPIHNNKQFMNQVSGRLCRISKDKTIAQLYVFWDQHVFGKRPLMNFKRWYNVVKVKDGKKWVDVNTFLKGYRDYVEEKRYQEKGFGANSPFVTAQAIRSRKV